MNGNSPQLSYRPEIDGLRALAVVAVIFYHAKLGINGGYVGVDIFFIISGYLITSLILKDLRRGAFRFTDFWERRIRRIMPAMMAMTFVVLACGWFFLAPFDYANLGKSVLFLIVFSSNVFTWRIPGGYFAPAAEEFPLLHTWSLAVEEQFYFIIPIILWLISHFLFSKKQNYYFYLFTSLCIGSFIINIYTTHTYPGAAFNLLPPRAWELLLGSMLATMPAILIPRGCLLRETFSCLGILLILISCFHFSHHTLFPGFAVLLPTTGTFLYILANQHQVTLTGKFFSLKPIVFIGLISYSLYLWHWPLFAFSSYLSLQPLSLGYRFSMVILTLILGFLSWRYIETPFRKRIICSTKRSIYLSSGIITIITFITGWMILTHHGFSKRYPEHVNLFFNMRNEEVRKNQLHRPTELIDALNGRFPSTGETNGKAILIWGDSHAQSILPAIDILAKEYDISVISAWYAGTAPILGYESPGRYSMRENSKKYNDSILKYIKAQTNIKTVLLVSRWHSHLSQEKTAQQLISTVEEILNTGAEVWVMMEIPSHQVSVPKALMVREIRGTNILRYSANIQTVKERNQYLLSMSNELVKSGAKILDINNSLIDSDNYHYLMDHDNHPLYHDNHHLSIKGAIFVTDSFIPLFNSILNNN